MKTYNIAFAALALAMALPAVAAHAANDARSCVFRPASDRDGTFCSPYAMTAEQAMDMHGLKVVTPSATSFQQFIDMDNRGSSHERNN